MSATYWYGSAFARAFTELAAGGGTAKTWKVALLDQAYVPADDHDFYSDVSANEAAGAGYAAGGGTLTGVTATYALGTFTLDADDWLPVGMSVDARYAVVYLSTGVAATSPLVALVDLTETDGEEATVTGLAVHTSGMLAVSVETVAA